MNIQRIASIVLWILLALSVVLFGIFYFGNFVPGTEGTPMEEPLITNKILLWAFILMILTLVVALVFPLIYIIMNPKSAIRLLIILAVIAVFVFIAYSLGSDEIMNMPGYNGPDNVGSVLKKADTGLILTYILFIGALGSILYTEISKIFK
ncbi:MAG: hypothetical protein ISS19_07270 [Bacteroidales bacterium]|nr:hypothetical protein [Bacteroidales bacterium]